MKVFILVISIVALVIVNLLIGSVNIPIADVCKILLSPLSELWLVQAWRSVASRCKPSSAIRWRVPLCWAYRMARPWVSPLWYYSQAVLVV